jgi:hypothetical protein
MIYATTSNRHPQCRLRSDHYWLASWTVMIALMGILFTCHKTMSPRGIATWTGVGVAIATSCYGLYMIKYGRRMIKSNPHALS